MTHAAGPRAAEVDQQAVDDYRADGAVVVRGLFTADEVELVAAGIERNLREPGPLAGVASADSDAGRFVEDFCNWERIPEYETFIRASPAAAVAGALMGTDRVRLFHDHMLVKEPGTRQRTPWHQDQPYYNVEGRQNASMWMPVDPVSRESTLEFVAGSHLGPWLMPRTFLDEQAKWFPEGSLADLPDVDADRSAFRIVGWEMEPGDAVFFHMLTLHARGWRRTSPARVLGALPRRRRAPRATRVAHVAGVPRPARRAAGGGRDGPPPVPGAVGAGHGRLPLSR